MSGLTDSITTLKGIGEKKALIFQKLGISSVYDLISYFPRKYEDRSTEKSIALILDGETVCVRAVVADEPRLLRIRRGMELVKFKIADETGLMDITYFNQSYMKNNLHRGEEYVFYGKTEVTGRHRSMTNPVCEKSSTKQEVTGKIIPVYRLTAGLNQRTIMQSMRAGLDLSSGLLPEVIPLSVRERQKLTDAGYAFENIHFPSDYHALETARQRIVFEELFVLASALGIRRHDRQKKVGIRISPCNIEKFYSSLPFVPTRAQKRAVEDALNDIYSGSAMNRLVQGDVGSGKTLVAAAVCYAVCSNGHCCAFMAPTEILAEQHLRTFRALLGSFGFRIEKLTGSMTAKEKREVKELLRSGKIDIIIGTHALFSSDTEYTDLALVITDEQHRFGVMQRASLAEKALSPHVLVMSATPIPRTLALIIYGDLDVSIIDEMPAGRKTVETFAVDESYRERLNRFILKQCSDGNQVFVVCPMVEENEENDLSLKSAEEHTEELRKEFPQLRVGCVHGKMKSAEKDTVMARFASGEIQILVSTTVIEVGVDVPNATLMIVENAERFGLSQLHQLRGRVGRGSKKSYCILVTSADDENVRSRLNILCRTNDGFKISEEDLRLRGPGDFFGSRQHGLPEMHIADLGADVTIMQTAKEEAQRNLDEDPDLSLPQNSELKRRVAIIFSNNINTLN